MPDKTPHIEKAAKAVRDEIVRQYRDDERGKCPAGALYYEDEIGPYEIARAALSTTLEPSEDEIRAGIAAAKEAVFQQTTFYYNPQDLEEKVIPAAVRAALNAAAKARVGE